MSSASGIVENTVAAVVVIHVEGGGGVDGVGGVGSMVEVAAAAVGVGVVFVEMPRGVINVGDAGSSWSVMVRHAALWR